MLPSKRNASDLENDPFRSDNEGLEDETLTGEESAMSSIDSEEDSLDGVLDDSYQDSFKSKQKVDSEDSDEDIERREKRHKILTYIALAIVVIVLIALMAVGTWMSTHKAEVKKQGSSVSNSLSNGDRSNGNGTKTNRQKTFMDTLGIPKYYQAPNTQISAEDKATADADAMSSAPVSAFSSLAPSVGMTSKNGKDTNADGTINKDYSFITANDVVPVIQDDIQRLINPVYGQWSALQQVSRTDANGNPNGSAWASLSDMFSQNVALSMTDEASTRKVLNLYADWDKNYYNGEWPDKSLGDPIVGTIDGENCKFSIQGVSEDHIDCYVDVKYTGTAIKDGKLTSHSLNKRLSLHYKINYDEEGYSSRKVLLTSVEQN